MVKPPKLLHSILGSGFTSMSMGEASRFDMNCRTIIEIMRNNESGRIKC